MDRRRCELGIDRRNRTSLLLRNRFEMSPALGYTIIERENPPSKADSHIAFQPALQRASPRIIITQQLDPFSNLADRQSAEVQHCLRRSGDPSSNAPIRARLDQLRHYIRVQQEA